MSSKKLVYFLVISLVYGLIAGGLAHGQSSNSFTIWGTVTDAADPVAGLRVTADNSEFLPFTSRDDGTYQLIFLSFTNGTIRAGDQIQITAADADGNDVASVMYTVTAADVNASPPGVTIDIDVNRVPTVPTTVTTTVAPNTFNADTAGTGTVTVTVDREGPVTDETVTLRLSPAIGTVSRVTNNGDGTYSATYTSGGAAGNVTLTATATQANASGTAAITVNAGPPSAIALSASSDSVSSGGNSIITAMVTDSAGNGVGGVSLAGATSSGGTLTNFAASAVFGTYTATYTAPTVDAEGAEMITVTADGVSADLTLKLTLVPPKSVNILVVEGVAYKVDGQVPADGVNVTVTVGSMSPQTVRTDRDGAFTVTTFNPLGAAASSGDSVSIVVTDSTGAERGSEMFILTSAQLGDTDSATVTQNVTTDIVIPPRSVSILVVEGVAYKVDGQVPADGVNVTVTVGSMSPQTVRTDRDGAFTVTTFNPLGVAASSGDPVSIVVTDSTGAERGSEMFILTSTQLGETDSATVTRNVTTDIIIPPRSVSILVVEGVVYKEGGTIPAGDGLDVTITVGTNPSQTAQTDGDGSFTATTINLLGTVATTGDSVSIVVTDDTGVERGSAAFTLTNIQLGEADSATVTQDVTTDIGSTSRLLAVTGTVYLKNGDTDKVAAESHFRDEELTVVVTNANRNFTASGAVDNLGEYAATFFMPTTIVAETGDVLTIEVQNEAGEMVGGGTHTLTTAEVELNQADVNIETEVPAKTLVLDVAGSVIELNGNPAGPGLEVTLTLRMNGQNMMAQVFTDATGRYGHTFINLLTPVAATGDILAIDVLRPATGYHGHRTIELRSYQIVFPNQPLRVDPIKLIPPTLQLGGLSINPNYAADGLISLDAIHTNPDLLELIPSGILLVDLLQGLLSDLPPGFDPTDEHIAMENFGNGIMPRPAWHVLGQNRPQDPGRWLNGDKLSLYVLTGPTAENVTFTLSGPQPGMVEAVSVAAGSTFMHTFQLEEERAVLLLPSWPGLNANMPVFSGVTLMIDGQAPTPMTSKAVGDSVVWEAAAALTPGSKVAYYYRVELAQSYELEDVTLSSWPMPDPRNLQLEDRGIVETLLAPEGPELKTIITTMDLNMRSVFTVPVVTDLQALWVGEFDLSASADGAYRLDTVVEYESAYVENITGKMFMVDRTPPTADITVDIGESSGMYQRNDGSYVAAAHTEAGTLNLTATPMGDPSEPDAYLYQMISVTNGDPGNQVWHPWMLNGDLLSLTYMAPHQIQVPVGDAGALGTFGIRAVGIDSLLNISSNTMPRMLDIVPPDADTAAVTLVHADYNGDGTTDGPFEMEQRVSDGVTIFSNRSDVTLTVEMMERTPHPLTSIAIDFQINGEGDWKPIAMLTGDDIADAETGLQVNWNRMSDFADLLDIDGQAMVRVTVTNALDVEGESIATFELIPPALRLGGLSVNTHYADVQFNALGNLINLGLKDIAEASEDLIGILPSGSIPPGLLLSASLIAETLRGLRSELPPGFDPTDEHIDKENFGNGITPRPIWHILINDPQPDPGRWVNSDKLNLYTVVGPTAESVTFSIAGPQSGMVEAVSVPAGGTFTHTFQLEEELATLFLPSGDMPVFESVNVMIDGHAPMPMEAKSIGGTVVWEAAVELTPGSKVAYYYQIELAQSYYDALTGLTLSGWPMPDPRNLQLEDRGILQAVDALLTAELNPMMLDPMVRSVFTVPTVDDSQSLWVGKFDFAADGAYQLDVDVQYRSGATDRLTGKMFTVDRTSPTADVMLTPDAPGENIGMYLRDDGVYIATALPVEGEASLTLSATPTGDGDPATYLYQIIRLDAAGSPAANAVWEPVATADLLSLNMMSLMTNPLEALLPVTYMPPHQIQMFIRGDESTLMGRFGLRTVGIDDILNINSNIGPGVLLNIVPPDPDRAMVTRVQTDYDANGTMDGPFETQSTAGDVTIFSDTMVTLAVEITERTDHPLSIVVEYQIAGGGWQPIGMLNENQLANAVKGDQLEVQWQVGDYVSLPDTTGHVMVRTVATNALGISEMSMATFAYQRRLPPEISAVYAEAMDSHPDSGAARGEVTISAFTQVLTNPVTTAVQFEIRRSQDTDWGAVGIAQLADTTVVSNVQIAIIEDLVGAVVNGAPTASIAPFYRQWTLSVDTTLLEDTILDDTPAASDATLDDNPYIVRAIAVDTAGTGYPAADGVMDDLSVDNYSPTEITQVGNEVDESLDPREDGSYYVSGLLAEGVPDPMLTLIARTGAHPGVFAGGIKLTVNDRVSGAVLGVDAVFNDAGNYTYKATLNIASIPNGMYTFMAVAHAADGSPEARIVAMEIAVEVGNFTPPPNFAAPSVDILSVVDTLNEARSPSEIDTMYPIGFPAIGDTIEFTLTVPNVAASDLDVLIGDDGASARTLGALTDDGIMVTANADGSTTFAITLDTSVLDEGRFNLVGVVIKPNGTARFGLPGIRVDRSPPVVKIVSPTLRSQLTTLPTLHITYTDASGFNPTLTDPMPVVITLTRLPDGEAIDVVESMIHITAAATGEVLTQSGNVVYTHASDLAGGAYRIEATATDVLGHVGAAEVVEFTVEGVKPTVSIVSPLAGQIVDPRQPLIISTALTGSGELTVTEFQINGTDMEGTLEDKWLTYTMQPPLVGADDSILQRGSDNTISVKIVDGEGNTAESAISFAVSLDSTPPVISGPSPQGEVTRKLGRITARVTDAESDITRIMLAIDDNPLQEISFSPAMVVEVGRGTEVKGQTNFNFTDSPLGTHSVTLVAESTGGASTLTWTFTVVNPDTTPPQVVTYSPLGIIRTDRPVLAATVSDESGFKSDGITLILAGVPGNQGSGRRSSPTSTTVTFTPSISVTPGPYTARITVIDRYNNRTEAEWQFTVELDDTPPMITTTSPHGVIHLDKPIISVSAGDDMSGVDTIEITVKDGKNLPVDGVAQTRSDKTSATFTPTLPLKDGTHTVDVKVTDMSGNQASSKWQFTVELDMIPPSVLITRPSQEHTENRRPIISATYTDNMSGVDGESVKLWLDGAAIDPDEMSETQVTFTPKYDLQFGQHTVKLELSDLAPNPNTAVQEWTFFVERIGIANARNYPNPFEDNTGTTLAFRLSRQASITIRIYDFTGRLVAQPIADSIREAGPVEIVWQGETNSGDNLARGVYFCHILMESELEPQSAILKMAIVSD